MMKQKKLLSLMMAGTMMAAVATGCAGQVATTGESEKPAEEQELSGQEVVGTEENNDSLAPVKTGLSIITSAAKSVDAAEEEDGMAQADIALTAVTVDDEGVIDSCVIDAVQAKIYFDMEGNLVTDSATEFLSKNELGADYGLSNVSSVGKEWNEQAAAIAEYAVGKTVEEIKGIAIDESGRPADADLAASATIAIGDFITGIEAAVNNAVHLGAQKGDSLALETDTNMSGSSAAAAEAEGVAQAYSMIAAVTWKDESITSCHMDAVQVNVNFDTAGKITSDLAAPIVSRNAGQ